MRLRPAVQHPVFLLISRQSVEEQDVERVWTKSIRFLMATREDTLKYRQQVSVVFDGYDADARELVDVPEVRQFVRLLCGRWPEWAYFLCQTDASIGLMVSVLAGTRFPGGGAVEIDTELLGRVLLVAFDGMNSIYDKFNGQGLTESMNKIQSDGLIEIITQM